MVIRLAGEFLPDGWNIATQYDEKEPNYRLIDEFWGQLTREANEFLLSVPDALNAQLQKIKERLSPSRIILFGSRARGDFHANSDINIAVETSKPIGLLEKMKGLNIVDLRAASDSLKKVIEREGVSLL
jgi:predicted nucleotidyltransferase